MTKFDYIISTFFFHVFFALVFSMIYYKIGEAGFKFIPDKNKSPGYIYYLSLSMGIQTGVGITNLMPTTELSSLILSIQQFIMIATNVLIVYVIFKS